MKTAVPVAASDKRTVVISAASVGGMPAVAVCMPQDDREPTVPKIVLETQALIHRDDGVAFAFTRCEPGAVIQI
jgi:hypothetical protein